MFHVMEIGKLIKSSCNEWNSKEHDIYIYTYILHMLTHSLEHRESMKKGNA